MRPHTTFHTAAVKTNLHVELHVARRGERVADRAGEAVHLDDGDGYLLVVKRGDPYVTCPEARRSTLTATVTC